MNVFFLIILATNVNLSCTFVQKYLEEVGVIQCSVIIVYSFLLSYSPI